MTSGPRRALSQLWAWSAQFSLRWRLTLLAAGAATVGLAVSGLLFYVTLSSSVDDVDRDRLLLVLGVGAPLLVAAVASLVWFLTGIVLGPVEQMSRRAARISFTNPEARLPQPPGSDELAELGANLNRMLDRIAETMAHERAFVDEASHELRTPIAVLRAELELARMEASERPDAEPTVAALDSALEETDRLASLAERILVLAKADSGRAIGPPERVRLAEVVQRVVDRSSTDLPGVEVDVGNKVVLADPVALEQLLRNLVTNASRWADSRIRIDASKQGRWVLLRVCDDGPGFSDAMVHRAFERFSREDPVAADGGGAGLGLAIVAAIADDLGGRVRAENGPPLGGAVVTVHLPNARRRRRRQT